MALLGVVTASAQTTEQEQASRARMAQLAELRPPRTTGLAQVDALQARAGEIAKEALRISYRLCEWKTALEKGEARAATLPEAIALGEAVSGQAAALKEAAQILPEAAGELKSVRNPMKLKGAKSSVDYSKTVLEIVGEEAPFQIRTAAGIIRTLKGE